MTVCTSLWTIHAEAVSRRTTTQSSFRSVTDRLAGRLKREATDPAGDPAYADRPGRPIRDQGQGGFGTNR